MGTENTLAQLTATSTVSAQIHGSEFNLESIRTWRGKDTKWRLSGTVGTKSILDLATKSMLGPNKDVADVIITITNAQKENTLHANLTSSMERDSIVEITFTLLDD